MRYLALIASLCACGDNGKRVERCSGSMFLLRMAAVPACVPSSGTSVTWRQIGTTDGPAIIVVSPPDDPRLFVVEDGGTIKILRDHSSTVFLDLSNVITTNGGEQGLLGLAFPPQYAIDGVFYVFYTTSDANVLARYHVMATDPDKADPASGEIMISIPDFATNHNGGMLEYGPEGYLYITTGDGGGGGDPHLNGQNPHALLAKLLRISTHHQDAGLKYSIPTDNPFTDGVAGAPEVYDIGFRNPWRYAFDNTTGDLWIGDVGQDAVEEIDLVPAGAARRPELRLEHVRGLELLQQRQRQRRVLARWHHDAAVRSRPHRRVVRDHRRRRLSRRLLTRISPARTSSRTGARPSSTRRPRPAPRRSPRRVPSDVTWIDDAGAEHGGSPQSPSSIHKAANGELYMTDDLAREPRTTAACSDSRPTSEPT